MFELEPPPRSINVFGHEWRNWLFNVYRWIKANMSRDFFVDVARGLVTGHSTIHKFGRNSAVGTSIEPICEGGFYRMPQATATVTLAAISTSASDTAAGTGARQLTIIYLDSTGAEQTGTISMNGTTETTDTITGVLRVNRIFVSQSGSYADQGTPSQAGVITVRVSGAGATWATLTQADTNFGNSQSLIGFYTVPLRKKAYILTAHATLDSGKTVDLYFFKRENILETAAPYSAFRLQNAYIGIDRTLYFGHSTYEEYPELTDIGFMAKVSTGTADVSVEFELLIIDN